MPYKNKIHLISKFENKDCNIFIHYNDREPTEVRQVIKCLVVCESDPFYRLGIYCPPNFEMHIDERFNELDFFFGSDEPFLGSSPRDTSEYLKSKYEELKSTDFRYKRGEGYDGDRTIYLEDFISFLKKENRNDIIEKVLS